MSSVSYKGEFYQVSQTFEGTYYDEVSQHTLYEMNIFLSQNGMEHTRSVYNLLDLMSDIGGLHEVVMIALGVFIYPISYHSFVI